MNYIELYIKELIWLLNEMSPYLMLGFLIAGILHAYLPQQKLVKYIGKNNLNSVINASLFGIPLPLCSCGVIPTGVSLNKNGASKGATVSFLISTPQTGVDSILATYALLGLPFALIRPIIAFVTGNIGGLITNKVEEKNVSASTSENSFVEAASKDENRFKKMLKYAFVDFLKDISKWLIIGLLIAAFISLLIPDDFFAEYLSNPFLSMLVILAASVPLYVCATGSIPIAAVLLAKGISPGTALVFLMAGPATNAATITVIGKTLGKKTLTIYLATIMIGAVTFGLLIDYLLPASWFSIAGLGVIHQHANHILPNWINYFSSITLVLLIIYGYVKKEKVETPIIDNNMDSIKIKVKGMTCNHCKANVERNINAMDGVKSATVNLESEEVTISGDKLDLEKIKHKVDDIGYEFVSKV
ncbi:MAG: heavy metal-associated domain-containing protein [Thalassobius sp.]|nr:heavy metal-associated domain-containing protein [Thalassovita sp.]